MLYTTIIDKDKSEDEVVNVRQGIQTFGFPDT